MSKKITVYIHDENLYKLEEYKNKSKIINLALNMLFQNRIFFESKKHQVLVNQQELEYKHKMNEILIEEYDKIIEEIEEKTKFRPERYEETVHTLRNMKDVKTYDLIYQAELLDISPEKYRGWLLDDGYYKEIFLKE